MEGSLGELGGCPGAKAKFSDKKLFCIVDGCNGHGGLGIGRTIFIAEFYSDTFLCMSYDRLVNGCGRPRASRLLDRIETADLVWCVASRKSRYNT